MPMLVVFDLHRIQLLEAELRRNGSSKRTSEANSIGMDNLQQELASVRKELEASERIAKQADVCVKFLAKFRHRCRQI